MASFKDSEGRVWQIEVDVTSIKLVKSLIGVNLYQVLNDGFEDLSQAGDVLYVLCKDQAEERKMSDADFGRMLKGDVFGNALAAFNEAFMDFFPDAKARSRLRAAKEKDLQVAELVSKDAERKLAELDPAQVAAEIIAEAERRSRRSSGSSPASSESTPAPTPSES